MDYNGDILKRVKLLMNYQSSKTLSENVKLIEQEPDSRFETQQTKDIVKTGEQDRIENEKQQKENEVRNTYPNYCKYKDKASSLPENCNLLDENEKIITKYFCYYSAPSMGFNEKTVSKTLGTTGRSVAVTEKGSKTQGYFIPNNAEIMFWDVESVYAFYSQILKKYPNVYKSKNEKQSLLSNISEILPIDSIRNFTVNSNKYLTWLTLPDNGVRGWAFKGFYSENNKSPYITPSCEDVRTKYQKCVDDLGFYLQIGAALGTALAGLLCEGCTMPLTIEILTVLGLGTMTGYREYEKGENINASFSFITGALPLLKLRKWFKGVNPKAFEEVSQAFIKQGKSAFQDAEDLLYMYDGLSDDGKLLMNQMLRMDDVTKSSLINTLKTDLDKELSKTMFKGIKKALESNPEKIINVPFIKRLYVRELGTNGVFLLGGLVSNLFFDGKLNKQDRDKLDGIYFNCPEKLKNELVANIIGNSDKINEITNSKEFSEILDRSSKKASEGFNTLWQQSIRDSVVSAGGKPIELEDNSLKAEDLQFETLNNEEVLKVRKDGWLPLSEIPLDVELPDTFRRINNTYYYKINVTPKIGSDDVEPIKSDTIEPKKLDSTKIN